MSSSKCTINCWTAITEQGKSGTKGKGLGVRAWVCVTLGNLFLSASVSPTVKGGSIRYTKGPSEDQGPRRLGC